MTDIAIITPTRGRPARLVAMALAVAEHATADHELWIGLDDDDSSDYTEAIDAAFNAGLAVYAQRMPRRSLSSWTNLLAARALETDSAPRYLLSLGDDHIARTPAWDLKLIEAIESQAGPGFAYGNDRLQGERLPTAWLASAEAVREVGWMMLPTCQHLYVDNAVLELGRAANRIRYVPDVTIEHMHPSAGKSAFDASYAESNAQRRFSEDRKAFVEWRDSQLERDAATLGALKY